MQEIKLSPRLACIAGLISPGARLADVGTDHAHLPLYLLQRKAIGGAVASDLREGPLARARENAESCGLLGRIDLRLAAGLDAVAHFECDTVSIAGMGGETIAEILSAAPWTAAGAHMLLLQPMTRIPDLRRFLYAHGYEIEAEHICREERRLYIVLVVRGGAEARQLPLADCFVSPALLRDPLAEEYIGALLVRERRALSGMEHGAAENAQLIAQRRIVSNLQIAMEGFS